MNKEIEYCEKVSKCIRLINTCYPEFKKEITKSTTLNQLTESCRNFVLSHQNEKKNEKEIEKYIRWRLK